MSTNFYWKTDGTALILLPGDRLERVLLSDPDHPVVHLGKRDSAGWYCHPCELSMSNAGNARARHVVKWHVLCPSCCAEVHTVASSWAWAHDPLRASILAEQLRNEPCIIDEYGTDYTGGEFLEIVKNCKVVITELVGKRFS